MALRLDFSGRVVRRRRAAGLTVTETTYGPGEVSERHAHPEPYLCLVRAGSFSDLAGPRREDLGSGEALLRSAGENHRVRFGPAGARCLMIQLGFSWLDRHGPPIGVPASWSAEPALEFLRGDADAVLALEEALVSLLPSPPTEDAPPRERRLDRIRGRLREDHARPLRLGDLAAQEGVHPAHLARAFRRAFGRTMSEYRREVRLRTARTYLDGGASIAAAAAAAGFADQSHLTRILRAELGMTPGSYRRRAQEAASRAKPVQDGATDRL